jgi:hypothetical protein
MEHRRGRRQATNFPVRFFAASGITGMGRILNISSSGAFMETNAQLRPLSLVYLESATQPFGNGEVRRITASVVRRDAIGVGIEWCESAVETTGVNRRLAILEGDAALALHP